MQLTLAKMPRINNKLQTKELIMLSVAGLCTVILLFYYFLYLPQQEQIAQLNNQLQTEKQRLQIVEKFVLAHPDADKYLQDINQNSTIVNKMLPNELDISDFLLQIESIAKTADTQLIQVKPAQAINQTNYREIPVEIVTRGNILQTINFMMRLAEAPRFNAVNSVGLQAKQDILETKISLVIYSFGVPQQAQPDNTKK